MLVQLYNKNHYDNTEYSFDIHGNEMTRKQTAWPVWLSG